MNKLLLVIITFVVVPIHAMTVTLHNPFNGDPQEARAHIAAKKEIEPWMVHQSIECGSLAVLKVLIDEGGIPADKNMSYGENAPNTIYLAPLHWAAYHNCADIARYLIVEKGVDPNIQEPTFGYTPAHYAARHSHTDVFEVLLKHNADLSIKNSCGETVQDTITAARSTNAAALLAAYKGKK